MLVSFGFVPATGCMWLHTRVISVPGRWREEDCDPDTALLCSMVASTRSSILVVVLVETKDLADLLDSDRGCVSCQ